MLGEVLLEVLGLCYQGVQQFHMRLSKLSDCHELEKGVIRFLPLQCHPFVELAVGSYDLTHLCPHMGTLSSEGTLFRNELVIDRAPKSDAVGVGLLLFLK